MQLQVPLISSVLNATLSGRDKLEKQWKELGKALHFNRAMQPQKSWLAPGQFSQL